MLAIAIGSIVSRMVPQFRLMQERIDGVNRVLREQITGIRVVRAFVREPDEARALRRGQRRPHRRPSLRAGRLMAFMFPIVMLVLNVVERRRAVVRRRTASTRRRCRSAR